MFFFRANIIKQIIIIPALLLLFTPCAAFSAAGVKTSFKKYALFTYNDQLYLCEPYLVQQNEWLYKIFRQKGEISASDFPLFLKIFKHINPDIGNIDAISPGSRILIPLKPVDKNAYEQENNGTVEVPVLAFSTPMPAGIVSRHTHKHKVKAGDTISELLSKEFLTSGGNVSKVGEKTILHLNPDIKDINYIYQGTSITLPNPSLLSQPWFNNFIAMKTTDVPPTERMPEEKRTAHHAPQQISMTELAQLKRYTRLIQGHLMHQGNLFFPPVNQGDKPKFIDLSKTPVMIDTSGKKTLLLGPERTAASMDPDIVAAMRAYWKDLQFKHIRDVLQANARLGTRTMKDVPESQESLIKTILAGTPYSYEPLVIFPVSLNAIQITVSLGRITHDHAPDILINSGSVYGSALDVLKHQGYRIIDLPTHLNFEETCIRLFSQLGYQVWKNPSFNADRKVKKIQGIYAEKGMEKRFFTRTPPFKRAADFLENEKIDVIMLDKEPVQ